MKIYLYLDKRIETFILPKDVLGNFSFDENPDAESKLINVEAKDGKWYLYSTDDAAVIVGKTIEEKTILSPNNYYIIKKNDKYYLIYTSGLFDPSYSAYSYDSNINITIGKDPSSTIYFSCGYISGDCVTLSVKDGKLALTKLNNDPVYINNNIDIFKEYYLNIGDSINIYGLSIIILNGILLINNPGNRAQLNVANANIKPIKLINDSVPKDLEVKDIDLYDKDKYFSKSPRIARTIQTKVIDLSPPPGQQGEEKLPLILTIGPMLTMAIVSMTMSFNVINQLRLGTTTIAQSLPQLLSAGGMLLSTLLWPALTRLFNKRVKANLKKETIQKYTKYLKEKEQELADEESLQRSILMENLIPAEQCLPIIKTAKINFWDKRIEQDDFLEVRIGVGNVPLDVEVNYPEEGFTIDEDELRKKADEVVEKYKYINSTPMGYSFYKNKITAFMGLDEKCYGILHNIILQLITFYSYDDIKLVLFTNKENEHKWEYIKYLSHSFSDDKSVRFFAAEHESAKRICDFLNIEVQNRMQSMSDNNESSSTNKPHYIIITDDYDMIKSQTAIKTISEIDGNIGFSLLIKEKSLNKLPSKCNNFINLSEGDSRVLINSFEKQEQYVFRDEINYGINMMGIARHLSNIPIEFEEGNKQLPEAITFMEMEKVGKVEQLNILNRWNTNDSTASLKAEIGVDEEERLMYLDIHEKFHGPHGLIAGTTGSGKSEFIITYILSLAMNYSPDDVAFILIDYKGGGLALAFENKTTGVSLPHLAGTITNLDKSEMDRTLVSIDSEVKRRQKMFNEARDLLGESTIDIYKYQRYYKEGKLTEPIPHLLIICDEFAELKSQQPEFMDNLISVARIGRSLGVHLILATQKPSGVVNDQIWSNTKFRVCLKVNDASDSNEMLKRPDAAGIKQAGRFYLQVGYDEYFALGQSGWCGAKYYPSDKIIKQVDKSINFIDDTGYFIKSIQAGNNIKIEAQGEQLAAIMNSIIEVSKMLKKQVKRLWLNNIEAIILVDNLMKKYSLQAKKSDVEAIVGEYDAPEKQEQGLLIYSLKQGGNAIIYGNDEVERENLLSTIIYSTCIAHTAEELNIYSIDYGSEALRIYNGFPQIGGMVFLGEDEKFNNLFKLINKEIKDRKKLLSSYGGSLDNYNNKNEKKLPQIMFIINNYDAIVEQYNSIYEDLASIGRDCDRYGVYMVLTCNAPSSISRRLSQVFNTIYALHLNNADDYYTAFNMKCRVNPRNILGRGLVYNDEIHEFQTASIVDLEHNLNDYIDSMAQKLNQISTTKATPIPSLPEKVTLDIIEKEITTIEKVPIGIARDSLKVIKYDFIFAKSTTVTASRFDKINSFMDSLLDIFVRIPNVATFFIDGNESLPTAKEKKDIRYFDKDYDKVFDKLIEFEKTGNKNKKYRIMYIFYGLEKIKSKLTDTAKLEELFNLISSSDNSNIILSDGSKVLKSLEYDKWYQQVNDNSQGIWIGNGFGEQQSFRISTITKEHTANYSSNYGFYIKENMAQLIKLIEFNDMLQGEDEDEE